MTSSILWSTRGVDSLIAVYYGNWTKACASRFTFQVNLDRTVTKTFVGRKSETNSSSVVIARKGLLMSESSNLFAKLNDLQIEETSKWEFCWIGNIIIIIIVIIHTRAWLIYNGNGWFAKLQFLIKGVSPQTWSQIKTIMTFPIQATFVSNLFLFLERRDIGVYGRSIWQRKLHKVSQRFRSSFFVSKILKITWHSKFLFLLTGISSIGQEKTQT